MAATSDSTARYTFLVSWFDPTSKLTRPFTLSYAPADSTVEMYDLRTSKTFLKRTRVSNISLSDLYIGSAVNIFSRQLSIDSYGDAATRDALGGVMESVCVVVDVRDVGGAVDGVVKAGFHVAGVRMVDDRVFNGTAMENVGGRGERVVVLKLNKDNAVADLNSLVGMNLRINWVEAKSLKGLRFASKSIQESKKVDLVLSNSCSGSRCGVWRKDDPPNRAIQEFDACGYQAACRKHKDGGKSNSRGRRRWI